MNHRSRRRSLVALGAVLGVAAALALATRYVRSDHDVAAADISIRATPTGKGAELRSDGKAERLAKSSGLSSGQRIETPAEGGASLRLSTGTEMVLAGRTSFRVDGEGAIQRFSLQRGELAAHVAKLSSGQRFLLTTPDAEVEVRGTRFVARVLDQPESCGNASRTRVEVTEGLVEIRSKGSAVRVGAGQTWPGDCAPSPTPPRTDAGAVPTVLNEPAPLRPPASSPKHAAEPRASRAVPSGLQDDSPLAAQNDLFAEGVALRRQGDVRGALRAYQALIARFPSSPLAENAMVERMRLMTMSHDAGAAEEARRYLARYPRGFAVNEARQLVSQP